MAMIPSKLTFICLIYFICMFSGSVQARCSNDQIRQYDTKGMSSDEISDKCDMSVRRVERVLDNVEESSTSENGGGISRGASQAGSYNGPQYGSTCCDVFGVSRCMLVAPNPLGAACFCAGQGTGITCR